MWVKLNQSKELRFFNWISCLSYYKKNHLTITWKDKMTTYKQIIGIYNLVAILKLLFRNLFHKCSDMHLNNEHYPIAQQAHPLKDEYVHNSRLCLHPGRCIWLATTGSTRWTPHRIAAKLLMGKFFEGSIFGWEKPSDSMSFELCQYREAVSPWKWDDFFLQIFCTIQGFKDGSNREAI